MSWTVRPAVLADARGIAAVHVATWRAAYAGIVPQTHLDGLSVEKRETMWRGFFAGAAPAGTAIWVADEAAAAGDAAPSGGPSPVVGFVNVGPSRDPDAAPATGEVRAIYVLRSHWDTGAGRALHDCGVASLVAAGFTAATLWVLADNTRARRFYERRGWRLDGATKDLEILGVGLAEVRYRRALGGADGGAGAADGASPSA